MLVAANKELYVTLPKKQKMLLSKSIVNAVRSQNPPGRFLQKDTGKTGNGLYYDIGDQKAQEKTSQALREGAPDLRNPPIKDTKPAACDASAASNDSSTGIAMAPTSSSSPYPPMMQMPLNGNGGAQMHHQQQHQHQQQLQHPQQQHQHQAQPVMMFSGGAGMVPQYPGTQYQTGAGYQVMVMNEQGVMVPAQVILSPSLPPTVHAQGPVPERKPKKSLPAVQSINSNSNVNTRHRGAESATTSTSSTATSGASTPRTGTGTTGDGTGKGGTNTLPHKDYVESDDYVEPPAGLDPTSGLSFGSINMTDYEENLLSGGYSFGSTMHATNTNTNTHTNANSNMNANTASAATTANARRGSNNDMHVNFAEGVAAAYVAPVDGGLEPVGLSFGSMMSIGTQDKLEPGGLSFGSMMSMSVKGVDAVDGGLEAIGTSFGSLTLTTEDQMAVEDQRRLLRVMEADQESAEAMPTATFLNAAKSQGNLLECSDTDSDGEDESAHERSAQKSAEWEKLQATFKMQTNSMPDSAAMPPPMFPGGTPSTLTIPNTTFNRDFSQMSAFSVGDEDFQETIIPQHVPAAGNFGFSLEMPPPAGINNYGGGGGGGDTMPPPPPVLQKQDSDAADWRDLEISYLNRGESLSEDF
jgi:hypothetical protein